MYDKTIADQRYALACREFDLMEGHRHSPQSGLPLIDSKPQRTEEGVSYLTKPGVVMLARPHVDLSGIQGFLDGFDEDLNFRDYLEDSYESLPWASRLLKFAGQLCYMSFGPKRTKNAEGGKYIDHIKESKHGSVFEHTSYSFLLYGLDRSVTHELVRHRAGCAYSQLSQRYVDGKVLRFVERPEWQADPVSHQAFLSRIDRAYTEYHDLAGRLMVLQKGSGLQLLSAEHKTDLRKKVNQAARSILPNETEAPIVFSGNIRALRHCLEMRAAESAEVLIREVFFRVYLCLMQSDPLLFGDYEIIELADGTKALKTQHVKV